MKGGDSGVKRGGWRYMHSRHLFPANSSGGWRIMKIFEVEVGVGVCKKLKGSKPEIGGVNFLEGS